jgi:hypothetical protein
MSPFLITFFSTLLDDLPMFTNRAHRRIRLVAFTIDLPLFANLSRVFVSPPLSTGDGMVIDLVLMNLSA